MQEDEIGGGHIAYMGKMRYIQRFGHEI